MSTPITPKPPQPLRWSRKRHEPRPQDRPGDQPGRVGPLKDHDPDQRPDRYPAGGGYRILRRPQLLDEE